MLMLLAKRGSEEVTTIRVDNSRDFWAMKEFEIVGADSDLLTRL